MGDWRYELAGLSAQERMGAVKVYEAVAGRLAAGLLGRSPRAELRTVAAAEGLNPDHPWIGVAADELERSQRSCGRPLRAVLARRHACPPTAEFR